MTTLTGVLVIDDHPLFREALATAVGLVFPGSRTHEVASIEAGFELLDTGVDLDLALLDLNLPGVTGFDGLLRLRGRYPRLPVLVVSGLEEQSVVDDALRLGAAGFVPKSLGREVLGDAIGTVLDGDVYRPRPVQREGGGESRGGPEGGLVDRVLSLTPQQLRVLGMLREGLLNKQIAHELDVGATTVKKHVSEILRKLGVHSRTQAVIEVAKLDHDERFDAGRRLHRAG